jgi:hypothetical protein
MNIIFKLRMIWIRMGCWIQNNFFSIGNYREIPLEQMQPKKYKKLNDEQRRLFLERLNIFLAQKQEEVLSKAEVVKKCGESLLGHDNLNWFQYSFLAEFHFRDGRYRIVTQILTDISTINETIDLKDETREGNWCRLMRWLYQEIDDKRKIFDLDFVWFSVASEFVEKEEIEDKEFELIKSN